MPATGPGSEPSQQRLREITLETRSAYVNVLAGRADGPWWDVVALTASTGQQARMLSDELRRRREAGNIPARAKFLVFTDIQNRRMGSGGATLNALQGLAAALDAKPDEAWWRSHRVLVMHCGGDSGLLPQFSFSGKLFATLPAEPASGEPVTPFDHMMAASTAWAYSFPGGLLVASGDVLLTFDAGELDWTRPGVTGVAMRQPLGLAAHHGVYVAGSGGRVYEYLQKPTSGEVEAAGGRLPEDTAALDVGLLRFDPATAARLTLLAVETDLATAGAVNLYEHVTGALTGRWKPEPGSSPLLLRLADELEGVPFWCCVVEGGFTHFGTTRSFHRLLTESEAFAHLDPRIELVDLALSGPAHTGLVVDSLLRAPVQLDRESVVIESDLSTPVRAARGSILHGLTGLSGSIEIPEDTVVHQLPLRRPDGRSAWTIRVYGVGDNPKLRASDPSATWMGRPLAAVLETFGIDAADLWPDIREPDRSLWNAALFPVGDLDLVWQAAQWLLGAKGCFDADRWRSCERLSLEAAARYVDAQALADERSRRLQASWEATAVSLARSGADVRALLAYSPGVPALASAGRAILGEAEALAGQAPTEAASLSFQASLFLARAGMRREAGSAQESAFARVREAVAAAVYHDPFLDLSYEFRHEQVRVTAPPRIDLGGGWSDTPPFCLDWGGTVLNVAVELDSRFPIGTMVRRMERPGFRFAAGDTTADFATSTALPSVLPPGSPFAIHLATVRMTGLDRLTGAGLEIRTEADLPMGSGLGTSSILSATLLRALATGFGWALSDHDLLEQVTRLEQLMTTGGGWQDQAGGILPGAKLLLSGPGLRQRIRVEPLAWTARRRFEFEQRLVLYDTGIQRIARGLLRQVVGRYLAREVAAVQVLHSIKTLALEMAHALREGEWKHLGELLDRHWQLNQVLDPHTTNTPINALLREVRPMVVGAKLAGAGGGGFMLLLTEDPDAALKLRTKLQTQGTVHPFRVTTSGLCIRTV